ncbi:LOW QUALITY PROTEIN: cation/calcium exchanger 1-like [Asparagus officinalis]|uniref:LOW QUALITY PROTEIN: cation/calcium exchanger 1-like n=1 Tax=Asparagus officinalis TaxID=4686 RepID=UPI00098DEB86|nr:LOW QUALITY PROTEIN: cation/calcium exchanger 1-like [Asparagus officinalis]
MALSLSKNLKSFVNTALLLLVCFFFTSQIRTPTTPLQSPMKAHLIPSRPLSSCSPLQTLPDPKSKCLYLKSHSPCISQGYINYLHLFYCTLPHLPSLSYSLFLLSLLALFYLLADTVSRYFCSSIENLSRLLKPLTPPTYRAGVTPPLPRNGSRDVLSPAIVSFRSGAGGGRPQQRPRGAFFVSLRRRGVNQRRPSACLRRPTLLLPPSASTRCELRARTSCFFIVVLSSPSGRSSSSGRVNVYGALCFTSLYFVYVSIVSATHFCREKHEEELVAPILIDDEELNDPVSVDKESSSSPEPEPDPEPEPEPGASGVTRVKACLFYYINWCLYVIDLPLYLPRRLTIPDVSEGRWSRSYAVAAATLSPIFLATLWNSKRGGVSTKEGLTIYLYAALLGLVLGLIAINTTIKSSPPKNFLFPWLSGGFLMSVLWTYIIAEELVGLLVSLGYIFGINPAILGLTILAWGNSVGDMIANVAMATNGGRNGAQIAISGCYAGPIFNTLAGLGLSLVVSSWAVHPDPFVIPVSPAMFEIVGFMIGGLLWALVVLPRKEMKLDRVLGVGLLAIYLCFLSLRLSQSLGLL